MHVNKVEINTSNGVETLINISDSTVTPETLAQGVKAYGADGAPVEGTFTLDAEMSEQDTLIDQIEAALTGKAAGGGGGVGTFTKYVKITATPASTTSFVIENPLGGIAKKVFVQRTVDTRTSSRKIQQYIADLDFRMGVLYAVATNSNARYTVYAVDASANNSEFAITDGRITLYRYNSANTWDATAEYEVEIYQ